MGSIYMQKGRLKQSLIVGLTVFIVSGVSGIGYRVIQHRSMDTLIVYMPMLLLFCLAVASAEELWFRGIFLRKLEPFLGATRSLILTSIIFAVSRVDATHMSGVEAMRLYSLMFALGLVCGFLMLKTKNLWGSILVHTGPYFFYELCSGSFAIIE